MITSKHPTMKPVLVNEVTDDVRALRGTDVEQQQKVLTARAISDCMAGDLISKTTNPTDAKYYSTATATADKIDFNLVGDAGCRYVGKDTYINGPAYAVDTDDEDKPYAGFLYTLAVLPTGELLWGDYEARGTANGGIAYNDPADGVSLRKWKESDDESIPAGTIIRQIFWPHNLNTSSSDDLSNTDAYTRIGRWTKTASTLYPDPHYEWGDWQLLSGEKLHIVVTDPTIDEVQNPIVNAVYHVYTAISEFVLPEANAYRYGSSITILQYPDPGEEHNNLWSTYVKYDYTEDDVDEHIDMLCTPCPNRNTAKAENAYLDGLSPTEYIFEIVPLIDGDTKEVLCHTWEMSCTAEETEFTTGIAELLSGHTDSSVNDIVNYLNRKYYEDSSVYPQHAYSALEINRSMTASGYIVGSVSRLTSALAGAWSVTVKTISSSTDANFVKTSETSPSSTKMYFVYNNGRYYAATEYVKDMVYYRYDSSAHTYPPVSVTCASGSTTGSTTGYAEQVAKYGTLYFRDGGCYQLAIDASDTSKEPGFLNTFTPGTQYYELDSSLEAETIFSITGSDLQTGDTRYFKKYLNRHDLVYVLVKPATTQNHRAVREGKMASVVVKIVPDPHPDSYLHMSAMNPTAFTAMQLQQLRNTGRLSNNDGSNAETTPAATGAVIGAYSTLATKLQSKGLLFGSVDCGTISDTEVAAITSSGMYRFTPSAITGFPDGVTTNVCHLTVIDNAVAPSNLISDEDQYKFTEDEEPAFIETTDIVYKKGKYYFTKSGDTYSRISSTPEGGTIPSSYGTVYNNRVYYYFNTLTDQFTLAGTNGYVTAFEKIYEPYYERREDMTISTSGSVIQTLYQFDTVPGIWTRVGTTDGTTWSWSAWVRHASGEYLVNHSAAVTSSNLLTWIQCGTPVVTNAGITTSGWSITLPTCTSVPVGTTAKFRCNKFKLNSSSDTAVSITTTAGSTTTTLSDTHISADNYHVVEIVATSTAEGWIYQASDHVRIPAST